MILNNAQELLDNIPLERVELMGKGLEDLKMWISDLVSNGISTLVPHTKEPWESIATRMTDFKLGGIASHLRNMASGNPGQLIEEWHFEVVKLIAFLEAVILSYQKSRAKGEIPSIDIMRACGVNFKKEDVKRVQVGIQDCWRVMYAEEDANEYVEYTKLYISGKKSGKIALVIDFKGRNSSGDIPWFLSKQDVHFEAEMYYYPSAFPVRGLIEKIEPLNFPTINSINKDVNAHFVTAFSMQPLMISMPVVLTNCTKIPIEPKKICWNQIQIPYQDDKELLEEVKTKDFALLAEWNGWSLAILRVFTD